MRGRPSFARLGGAYRVSVSARGIGAHPPVGPNRSRVSEACRATTFSWSRTLVLWLKEEIRDNRDSVADYQFLAREPATVRATPNGLNAQVFRQSLAGGTLRYSYPRDNPGLSMKRNSAMTTVSASHLPSQTVAGWALLEKLGQGKSATVFKATKNSKTAAIKVFDREITRHLREAEIKARIQREMTMIGRSHPNLVSIHSGGFAEDIASYYIVMDYVSGQTLAKTLTTINPEKIPDLILQLSKAAQYLESLELCHRDIKPDNIMLTDSLMRLVLLDFGVLRPLNSESITDDETLPFVGTLRYSPPEFLLRQEEDSTEGWRAVTFYQIGAVLHDLIMQRPLFSHSSYPFAALCNAVQHQQPEVQSTQLPVELLELAYKCLLKDWRTRLRLVKWSSFDLTTETTETSSSIRQQIVDRSELFQAQQSPERPREGNSKPTLPDSRSNVAEWIKDIIRAVRDENRGLLRTTISVESSSDQKIEILTAFAESNFQGIPDGLSIQFEISAVEESSRILEIKARSFRHRGDPANEQLGPRLCVTRIYLAPNVCDQVERYLYQVIEYFQKDHLRSVLARRSSSDVGNGE